MVTHRWYPRAPRRYFERSASVWDDPSAVFRVALLQDTYSFSTSHRAWGDVDQHEIDPGENPGYETPGGEVTNRSIESDGDRTLLVGDDVVWDTTGTFEFRYAVLYDDTPSQVSNKTLLTYIDPLEFVEGSGTTNDSARIRVEFTGPAVAGALTREDS